MNRPKHALRHAAVLLFSAICLFGCTALWAGGAPRQAKGVSSASAAASEPSSPMPLIEPEELAKRLTEPKAKQPIVLQVGFEVLYRGAHIPGSIYAGPASKPEGLANLRKVAAGIPRNREVVIYCGCCPMEKCPNIRPAYAAMSQMGFRRLKVLDLPTDFARNWVDKKLPVESGPAN